MRRDARIDANQPEIVQAFRDEGAKVRPTHMVGGGFVDAVVGVAGLSIITDYLPVVELRYILDRLGLQGKYIVHEGVNLMVEIKDGNKPPSAQKLTADEEKFHSTWKGQICVVNSKAKVKEVLGK